MKARIEAYLREGQTIKPDWEAYIDNKALSLDERWEAFLLAPSEWKSNLVQSSLDLEGTKNEYTSPYDDFYMERGNTKSISYIFKRFDEDEILTDEQMNLAKEDAIKQRVGFYTYDW